MHIMVLNGPNLNRLGKRQPDVYGHTTLADVTDMVTTHAAQHGIEVTCRQSNNGWPVIINPGGFTHTSVALRDALAEVADTSGFVEVHISNVHAREPFRQKSLLSSIAVGVIAGLGVEGYRLAIDYFARR